MRIQYKMESKSINSSLNSIVNSVCRSLAIWLSYTRPVCSFSTIMICIALVSNYANAELTRLEIIQRITVAKGKSWDNSGPYERIVGKAHFAVDPQNLHNRAIVDLDKAPLNYRNRVEFAADIVILKPVDNLKGNHTVLFEVPNRGGRGIVGFFNKKAAANNDPEFADGFLLKQGFTMVWLGWQHDVPSRSGLLRLYAPIATEHGDPITGPVRAQIILGKASETASLGDRNHQPYLPFETEISKAVMTVRNEVLDKQEVIERSRWKFVGDPKSSDTTLSHVILEGGFQPGKIYEVVYISSNPKWKAWDLREFGILSLF